MRIRKKSLVRKRAVADFRRALAFCRETHATDLDWIRSRQRLVRTFDDFYEEYTYVVLASGFRAKTAARLTPALIACGGDIDRMRGHFRNERKIEALARVWRCRPYWAALRGRLKRGGLVALETLPHIGPITKFHLARNLGLTQAYAKPDVHLVRYARENFATDAQSLVAYVGHHESLWPGVVDFVLWIWLSHARGQRPTDCCHLGYRLR